MNGHQATHRGIRILNNRQAILFAPNEVMTLCGACFGTDAIAGHARAMLADAWHLATGSRPLPETLAEAELRIDLERYGMPSLSYARAPDGPFEQTRDVPDADEVQAFCRLADGAIRAIAFAAARGHDRASLRVQTGDSVKDGGREHGTVSLLMLGDADVEDPRLARAILLHGLAASLRYGRAYPALVSAEAFHVPSPSATLRIRQERDAKAEIAALAPPLSAFLREAGLTGAADGYDAAITEMTS